MFNKFIFLFSIYFAFCSFSLNADSSTVFRYYPIKGKILDYTKSKSYIKILINDFNLGEIILIADPNFKMERKTILTGYCSRIISGIYQGCNLD